MFALYQPNTTNLPFLFFYTNHAKVHQHQRAFWRNFLWLQMILFS
ncbi:hypothetical protein M075_4177 [Bacteroides fragilis str. 20793-3]|nr:hypothetical protein M080_3692 [Bacteroides fragilis str. 3397 T10]EXZ08352.1 hypothetical protein M073_3694 [Bacteroides fragilis str. DS-71]EYA37318.1 hypothetical protein M075_4177 [Bacteroides fragilis str. 20793-3]